MKTATLYTLLFCAATVAFVGWRVQSSRNQQARHVVVLMDLSLSHAEGCASLVGLAEHALQSESVPADTMLTVLIVGDPTTANEPWHLGEYPVARSRRVIEGRNANVRRRQEALSDIAKKCQAARRPTISPIYLGVIQAVADLRAQGCTESSGCHLYVGSDMEENVEPAILRFLNRSGAENAVDLPPRIRNEGVGISVCGLADRAGRILDPSGREVRKVTPQDPARDDRLRRVWLALFTSPDLVKFAPYCPKPSASKP